MATITAGTLSALRRDINRALEQVGKDYKVKIAARNAKYTEEMATFQLEVSAIRDDGTAATKQEVDFKKWYGYYGLHLSDLGRELTTTDGIIKITGTNSNSDKYPILAKNLNTGQDMKFPIKLIRELIRSEVELQKAKKIVEAAEAMRPRPKVSNDVVYGKRHIELEEKVG
jgi:hypothetical protein